MSEEWTRADLADDVVRGMVADLRPTWTVERIKRSEHGTDFVAILEVNMDDDGHAAMASSAERRVVLKATTAGFVDPVVARAEPRLFELVGPETDVPVPAVYGYCDSHDEYPAPFYLVEYVPGESLEDGPAALSESALRTVLRDAGRNLAQLHELGPLPAFGTVGVRDDDLVVLDTDDHPRYDDGREWAYDDCMAVLDVLPEGGWFPEKADDTERFADLVPALREYVETTVHDLPEPDTPTYCHWDYRYGNLLVDPDTGATNAVLDWANLAANEPAYNLTKTETHLLDVGDPDESTETERRDAFRAAYLAEREDWAFTDEIEERVRFYRFQSQLQAMACLPLWYEDATPARRDEIAAAHREFVTDYL